MAQVISSGKRKEASARAVIGPGKGIVRINSVLFESHTPRLARERIRQAFLIADGFADLKAIDMNITVVGGGVMGQADAVASAIARGLVEYTDSDELHDAYVKYERTFIAGDHRQTEVHKPSQSSKGPRHMRQKSYR